MRVCIQDFHYRRTFVDISIEPAEQTILIVPRVREIGDRYFRWAGGTQEERKMLLIGQPVVGVVILPLFVETTALHLPIDEQLQ